MAVYTLAICSDDLNMVKALCKLGNFACKIRKDIETEFTDVEILLGACEFKMRELMSVLDMLDIYYEVGGISLNTD